MSKHEDKEISTITACLLAFVVTALILVMIVMICPDKTIPSEEQKSKEQVTTEINTHVIRCTAYVNDTCAEYKVYNVIRE